MQTNKKYTGKMVSTFKGIVGDPDQGEDASQPGKSWRAKDALSGANQQLDDPWILPLEFEGSNPETISRNLVRMMVSTTLATITHLSQMAYDSRNGLRRERTRYGCCAFVIELLQCMAAGA
jgi:hypothetical protein